jgi:SAM-dependent methyltransferase
VKLLTKIRHYAGRAYHKFISPTTLHSDIRAYASIAEERGLEHIHYGYYENDLDDIKVAQDNLYLQIRDLIPAGVESVLDVGGGIGGVSNHLCRDGYRQLCIVPDPALIAAGIKRFPRVRFLEGTAESFQTAGKYDAAILIESDQYFSNKPQAIANVVRHLSMNAPIIFAEECSLESEHPLPREESLIANLKAGGYALDTRIDISRNVIPTCRYVYETFGETMKPLAENWRASERAYASGGRKYLLLRFRPRSAGHAGLFQEAT